MIAIYIDKQFRKFETEAKYAFDFVFRTMGYEYKYIQALDQLSDNDILFFYGLIEPTEKEILVLAFRKIVFYIPADPDFYQATDLQKDDVIGWKQTVKYLKNTPILAKKKIDIPIFYYKNKDLFYGSFAFDIVGNIFFHLLNSEEAIFPTRDSFGRFPDEASMFTDEAMYPFVNKFLWLVDAILSDAVSERPSYFLLKKNYWPKGENLAVAISHTVRRIKKWTFGSIIKSSFTDLFVFYKIKFVFDNFICRMKYIITNIEEYWNFDFIVEMEKMYDFKSTFFFSQIDKPNNFIDYSKSEEDVENEIKHLYSQGFDIALLGSEESAKSDLLEQEKHSLELYIEQDLVGVRQARNLYDQKITTEFHNKHKFYYDSTRSFLNQSGFKNGIGFPFYNFTVLNIDVQNNEKKCLRSSCLELPRNFSDESLKLSKYKKLSFDESKKLINKLIEIGSDNFALLNLDFEAHNLTDISYDEDLQRYLHDKLNEVAAYKGSLMQIAKWWRKREAVVVKEGKYGFSLYFPFALENFTLDFMGGYEVYEVEGTDYKIENHKIYLMNVNADTEVKIRIKAEEIVESEVDE